MDVETRKSILMDAFNELKEKWSVDERFLSSKEEEPTTVDGLPESKVNDLLQLKEKYKLDEIGFVFLVGAAVGFYQGQRNVKSVVREMLHSVNEVVNSFLRKS
ncbi:MAG: hypothetical protein HA489_02105 [Archaeoglobales archaeon]|jgi:hypothetical protein|nr:hypothetical protein [Archaeoglobi archaeon]NHW23037.1 hypothetical protein [Archaeoglobales archaeon]TDA27336.1 MAG: hypothetical protein DSO00_06715 [Archaeoglobi archaeon]